MLPSEEKPKLSEEILNANNIYFFQDPHGSEDLEDWIRPIREQLVRLRNQLPRTAKSGFAKELEGFQCSGQDSEEACPETWSLEPRETEQESVYVMNNGFTTGSSLKKIKEEMKDCAKIVKSAKKLRRRNEQECRWMDFLQDHFFKSFDKVHGDSNSHEDIHYGWELHQDVHWNEFQKQEEMNPKITKLTGPKPDLTYAFPVIDTNKVAAKFRFDEQVENFSLSVLNELRTNTRVKLVSAPTTKLKQWGPKKNSELNAPDLMCFPWAIVEAKMNKTYKEQGVGTAKYQQKAKIKMSENFCYCQAANASAKALILREELASKSKDHSTSKDALVIFAFTCIGPTVKLWVTYRQSGEGIVMVCIWATSLELTWGVMALRMVVENMREWVLSRAKSMISRWIGMVRNHYPPQTMHTLGRDIANRARRAVSCEPSIEGSDFTSFSSPTRISRSKVAPDLLRGESDPGSVGRRRPRYSAPLLQLQSNSGDEKSDTEEEDDSDGNEDHHKGDEEYASEGSYKSQSDEEEVEPELELDSNIDDDDEDEYSDDGNNDFGTSEKFDQELSEEEEPESELDSNIDNNDDDDDNGSNASEESDQESSEEEGYYIEEQRYFLRPRQPKTSTSPAKDGQSKNGLKKDQVPRPRLRRRSSHF